MLALAQIAYDCIQLLKVLEKEKKGLSLHNVRHAISMLAPLGTKSEVIDNAASAVYETVKYTGLVSEIDGKLYYGTNVAEGLN